MKKLAKKLIEQTKGMILSCVHFTQACYFVACNLKSYYKIKDYLHAFWYVIQILLLKKRYVPFAKGNNKLQKNILIFDMPEVMTCACACACCYAQKASRLYKNTRRKRLVNFMLADFASRNKQAKAWLFSLFNNMVEKHVTYCKKNKLMPILRLHSAGDIYHTRYENLLIEYTMQANKSLVIYTYTKKLNHEKIDTYNRFYNINIVKSLFKINGKNYINFGNIGYLCKIGSILEKKGIKFAICEYKLSEHDKIELAKAGLKEYITTGTCGTCTACMVLDIVLFKVH